MVLVTFDGEGLEVADLSLGVAAERTGDVIVVVVVIVVAGRLGLRLGGVSAVYAKSPSVKVPSNVDMEAEASFESVS